MFTNASGMMAMHHAARSVNRKKLCKNISSMRIWNHWISLLDTSVVGMGVVVIRDVAKQLGLRSGESWSGIWLLTQGVSCADLYL